MYNWRLWLTKKHFSYFYLSYEEGSCPRLNFKFVPLVEGGALDTNWVREQSIKAFSSQANELISEIKNTTQKNKF